MGMALHHLVADGGGHIQNVEIPVLAADLRMEHHLQKHVAQLVIHMIGVVLPDSLNILVAFLQKIRQQAFVGLLPIPRASLRGTKTGHDTDKIVHIIPGALLHGHRRDIHCHQMIVLFLTI